MEVQDSGQSFDRSQPIQKIDGDVGGQVDVVADGGSGGVQVVKRKRGRPPRAQAKPPPVKKSKEEDEEEDVCFICFDGGSLVLCDRRGCPKAYHPACVKRDEAFFQSKAKWNCGWHICSICEKTAHHMCYTCTYSLCKGCIRKADYVCVRGDKGFCTICMKTIMLIENSGQGKDETAQVDFDDKTSWEYLFKVYWVYLKRKLSLSLDELTQAKNPMKGSSTISSASPSTGLHNGANHLNRITSDTTFGNLEANESKRRKTDEQIDTLHKENVNMEKLGTDETSSMDGCTQWATKELLDFVAHMKNGDTSVLFRFDVQALMLEYVKKNNLRDPRKKSQIICDSRLENLFGRPRVGHFEMLKLLEFHFFTKEDSQKNTINSTARHGEAGWNSDNMLMVGKDKRHRNHRKAEERASQNKLDEYAAIDVHNMNLIYLRRNLMENLIEDGEKFHGKVVGSIVRIRISGSDQKHDMYRLVQVVGTSKVDEPYKIGDKSADVMLEVLNLNKKETVSIDTISNQELAEDECRRLRQSIRCGLVRGFTVGEIQEKAVALQSVRLNDWMEAEILRLNNLRDRASEKGHKKDHRECVEKLQLLKTPEERERRLREIPEVHADPKMNPDYESDDTEEYFNKEHEDHLKPKCFGVSVKNISSPKTRPEIYSNSEEGTTKGTGRTNTRKDTLRSSSFGRPRNEVECNGSTSTKCNNQAAVNSSLPNIASTDNPSVNNGEIDKLWHYRDPNGKVQGPFSMVQLQKWSTTGYFPADMRIWVNREDESLLLNNVLKEPVQNCGVQLSEKIVATDKVGNQIEGLTVCAAIPSSTVPVTVNAPNSVNHEKLSDGLQNWSASHEDAASEDLPSPTPKKTSHEDEKVPDAGDKEPSVPPSKLLVKDSGNPPDRSNTSSLLVVGTQLPEKADVWGGYSPTPVKCEEGDAGRVPFSSLKPLEAMVDHVAIQTSHIEQIIHSSPPSSQPASNDLPSWHGVRETIEFSTLAEESVSDLLAEVDAMESQNGLPSPTSRRNSFLEDLFNGSIDDFSPTPDHGTRTDGFSSGGDLRLPCQSTTTDEHLIMASQGNNSNVFDLIKSSTCLPQSSISPEMDGETESASAVSIPHRTNSDNTSFKWAETEKETMCTDIGAERKTNTSDDQVEKAEDGNIKLDTCRDHTAETSHGRASGDGNIELDTCQEHTAETSHGRAGSEGNIKPMATSPKVRMPEQVDPEVVNHKRVGGLAEEAEDGEFSQPESAMPPPPPQPPSPPPPPPPLPPPTPLTTRLELDPVDPQRMESETVTARPAQGLKHTGRVNAHTSASRSGNAAWDPHQRKHVGDKYTNNNSPRERHCHVEDSGYSRGNRTSWSRQSSFGGGSGGGSSGGGGYSRPPSKGQRVCKFYESGRCKKGAACNYLHP